MSKVLQKLKQMKQEKKHCFVDDLDKKTSTEMKEIRDAYHKGDLPSHLSKQRIARTLIEDFGLKVKPQTVVTWLDSK